MLGARPCAGTGVDRGKRGDDVVRGLKMIKWINPRGPWIKVSNAVLLVGLLVVNATGLLLLGRNPWVIIFLAAYSTTMVVLQVLQWKRMAEIATSASAVIDVPTHMFIPRLEMVMAEMDVKAVKGQPPERPFYAIGWDEVYHVGDMVMHVREVNARTVIYIGPVTRDGMHDLLTLQVLVERAVAPPHHHDGDE